MFDLTKGIASNRGKQRQGGLDKIYIIEYKEYSRRDVVVRDNVIRAYPPTDAYEFDVNVSSFSEQQVEAREGEYYNQTLAFRVAGTQNSSQLYRLTKKRFRAIAKDRQGNYRMIGLWNGAESIVSDMTGANKADFNGYDVNVSGMELREATYITDIAFDSYFTVIKGTPDACL